MRRTRCFSDSPALCCGNRCQMNALSCWYCISHSLFLSLPPQCGRRQNQKRPRRKRVKRKREHTGSQTLETRKVPTSQHRPKNKPAESLRPPRLQSMDRRRSVQMTDPRPSQLASPCKSTVIRQIALQWHPTPTKMRCPQTQLGRKSTNSHSIPAYYPGRLKTSRFSPVAAWTRSRVVSAVFALCMPTTPLYAGL